MMRWWQISKRDQDLEREIRSDLELEEQEQRDRGLPDHEARFAAQHALGNAALIRDRTHETWGWTPFEHLWQDVHFGIRSLLKSRQFTIAAALTLALGIGTSTAMFSAILRPAKALAISGSRSFGFRIAAPARWQWQTFSLAGFPRLERARETACPNGSPRFLAIQSQQSRFSTRADLRRRGVGG